MDQTLFATEIPSQIPSQMVVGVHTHKKSKTLIGSFLPLLAPRRQHTHASHPPYRRPLHTAGRTTPPPALSSHLLSSPLSPHNHRDATTTTTNGCHRSPPPLPASPRHQHHAATTTTSTPPLRLSPVATTTAGCHRSPPPLPASPRRQHHAATTTTSTPPLLYCSASDALAPSVKIRTICVRGSSYGESDESDYYGMLDDVLEVEFYGVGRSIVALFKCIWFDTPSGVRVDRKHSLVDVKYKSRLRADDSYILASQAEQVYYTSYPSMTKDLKDWWAVVKTKPRGIYEVLETVNDVEVGENMEGEQFYQMNERVTHTPSVGLSNDLDFVNLVTGEVILVDAPNDDDDDRDDANEDSEEEAEFEDTMPPRSNRGKGTGQMGRGGGRDGGRAGGSSSSAGRGNERADDYDEFRGVTPLSVGHDIDIDIAIDEDEMTREVQPSSASVLRTRGPNRSIGVPRNPSLRETLVISASGKFENIKAKAAMFTIFKANFRGPWTSWDKVPQGQRDCMFKMFQNRHREWMRNARKFAARQALELDGIEWDREDMSVIRGHHPIWIPAEYWHEMIDKMASLQAADWGRELTSLEVHERTHCSNRKYAPGATGPPDDDPIYIYPKAGRAASRFREIRDVAQSTQTPDDPPIDEVALWEQSVGGRKKGRLFGFGTSRDPSYAITGRCSSSGATGESSSEIADLREQLKTMEQRHQEAEERHQKAEERHQAMYDWLRSSGFHPPSPTPTPTPTPSAPSPPSGPPPL
ncbi:hypothetical protein OSB04_005277 [Centaurea solstitialis]|uniref:DUF4216 domain-containing protein n=1 Tax=Centaurea solstitialis TaxID=347529 RepID=A0AA38WGL9_9ASTR|nr:hypothetical protein OSB04_005277 [Centaurea solstitialis]